MKVRKGKEGSLKGWLNFYFSSPVFYGLTFIKLFVMAKYGKKAQDNVERAMHEMKEGKLRSGNSNKKVTNPKQAVAIGLSEARKEGGKVPKKKSAKKSSK
jgi:hypothetical protein